jgi:hypothetical protein
MHMRGTFFFGILFAGTAAMVACGSKSDSTGTTAPAATSTSTTAATGSGGATSSASGTGGMMGPDCKKACTDLYNCGLAKDMTTMMQYCPGFKGGMELDAFLNGSMMNGCVKACGDNPALAGIVDPSNCKGTIDFIKGAKAEFKCSCEKGLGMFDTMTMMCK